MKTLRLLFLAGLVAGLLPGQILADEPGRTCVPNPDTGFPEAPNGSGACFDDGGFQLQIFDEADGFVLAANATDDNQWFRQNPNGKGKLHAKVDDISLLVYCSIATIEAGACNSLSGQAFEGTGSVTLNTRVVEASFFDCPLTARVTGTAMDGFDNVIDLSAALTLVPDDELGCRATVVRVEATPVLD